MFTAFQCGRWEALIGNLLRIGEVYGVRYVLRLPDCQTVQPGLKLTEAQDLNELIILGFDIKLMELDK